MPYGRQSDILSQVDPMENALARPAVNRLQTVANLIPCGTTVVADIGYDHGRLISLLSRQRPEIRVIGVERQLGAAKRFWNSNRLPAQVQARIRLIHGDGFEVLGTQTVETAVLAGLGERRIVDILDAAPQVVARLTRLVLAPLGTAAVLRPYLRARSWAVVEERLVVERGRFYQIFAACPGKAETDPDTWWFGTQLFEQRHPLLPAYLRQLAHHLEPMVRHADEKSHDLQQFCSRLGPAIKLAETRCQPDIKATKEEQRNVIDKLNQIQCETTTF